MLLRSLHSLSLKLGVKYNSEETTVNKKFPDLIVLILFVFLIFRPPSSVSPHSGGSGGSGVSRNGSVPRLHTNALGMVRKNLLIAEKSREKLPKERAKSDQPHSQTSKSALVVWETLYAQQTFFYQIIALI